MDQIIAAAYPTQNSVWVVAVVVVLLVVLLFPWMAPNNVFIGLSIRIRGMLLDLIIFYPFPLNDGPSASMNRKFTLISAIGKPLPGVPPRWNNNCHRERVLNNNINSGGMDVFWHSINHFRRFRGIRCPRSWPVTPRCFLTINILR